VDSERIEEYLEAIYKRQEKETPVSTSALAEDLGVTLPAVTDMLHHLKVHALIDYKPNRGAILTESGKVRALKIIRRHRLWERFLTDVLGMKRDKVHDQACKLEHIDSPDIEKGLVKILGDVDTCPHGQPIPDRSGKIKEEPAIPLAQLKLTQHACISAISGDDQVLFREIEGLGLHPHDTVTIVEKAKNGSLKLNADGKTIRLRKEMGAAILARPSQPEQETVVEKKVPLTSLAPGQAGVISSYSGPRGGFGRCLSLGFTPGSNVKMMENFGKGPVLVKLHDAEVALGRAIAEKILVGLGQQKC
jgi:DtxR family transcriptional regulator, Mn-dependent transcriptional regulator